MIFPAHLLQISLNTSSTIQLFIKEAAYNTDHASFHCEVEGYYGIKNVELLTDVHVKFSCTLITFKLPQAPGH